MRASRTPTCRLIDYSAPLKFDGSAALRKQIVRFVTGIRGERQSPVTSRQIVAWFRSTPPDFVLARLGEVVLAGDVRACAASLGSRRRHNGRTVYVSEAA